MATKFGFVGLIALQLALPTSFFGSAPVAEASVFSAVTSLFSSKADASVDEPGINSQKMPLLEAPINSSLNNNDTSPNPVIDNSALVAQSQPAPTVAKTDADTSDNTQISTYKVKAGDTVSGIAKSHGISTNTIIWANNLKKENSLTVGQSLVILPISGVKYVVAKGDTISTIAAKYKGDEKEIIAYNDLNGDKLKVGDTIVIPDGELSPSQAQLAQQKASSSKTSIVKKVASVALGVGIAHADDIPNSFYARPISGGSRTQGIHGNNGVDLANACGAPIYASATGDVVIAKNDGGYNGGYGNYVVVSHSNGSQTLYAHMTHASVTEGAHVTQGQQIGTIGSTGKVSGSTGCHVHFEIRNGITNPF